MTRLIKPEPAGPGEESVWDYPRPPRLEAASQRLRVVFAGRTVADTTAGFRLLETSHPPVYYLPPADVDTALLQPAPGSSFCEFKGEARYWTLAADGRTAPRAAWSYPRPGAPYRAIAGYFAFYASKVDECWVGGHQAERQEGDFYGGWITPGIKGPFKGGPGTWGW